MATAGDQRTARTMITMLELSRWGLLSLLLLFLPVVDSVDDSDDLAETVMLRPARLLAKKGGGQVEGTDETVEAGVACGTNCTQTETRQSREFLP